MFCAFMWLTGLGADTYWEAGDEPRGVIRMTWSGPEGTAHPSVASLALFVDRVKDPVIRTVTLSAGKSADSLVTVDSCSVADGYVGWIVLGASDSKPITDRCFHVTLAGANRMRLRG